MHKLYFEKIGWKTSKSLYLGMLETYMWIDQQVNKKENKCVLSTADLDMRDRFLS